jgi:hypothetical protein
MPAVLTNIFEAPGIDFAAKMEGGFGTENDLYQHMILLRQNVSLMLVVWFLIPGADYKLSKMKTS